MRRPGHRDQQPRWTRILPGVVVLLALACPVAGAQSGSTSLTIRLAAGIVLEPPRVLGARALPGPPAPARTISPGGAAGADACIPGAGAPPSGSAWRVLSLRQDGWIDARLVSHRAGHEPTAAPVPDGTMPMASSCGTRRVGVVRTLVTAWPPPAGGQGTEDSPAGATWLVEHF